MGREGFGGDRAGVGERRHRRGFDHGAVVEEVDDVVAAELGHARGPVGFAAQQPVGDEPVDREPGGRPGDAEAQRRRRTR